MNQHFANVAEVNDVGQVVDTSASTTTMEEVDADGKQSRPERR